MVETTELWWRASYGDRDGGNNIISVEVVMMVETIELWW